MDFEKETLGSPWDQKKEDLEVGETYNGWKYMGCGMFFADIAGHAPLHPAAEKFLQEQYKKEHPEE